MPTANFLPSPKRIPGSIGLSFSGGGYRATLFHLGAVRRLHEFGILPKITTVSSVSGGSILNGFLASRPASPFNGVIDFEQAVSKPMRDFCSLDIRRWLALESIIPGTHNSNGLANAYNKHLTLGKKLTEISDAPKHVFCSTDLAYGVNWTFKKAQCGDYQAGFMPTPDDWLVSTAVAASSCFPPVFKPLHLDLDPAKLTAERTRVRIATSAFARSPSATAACTTTWDWNQSGRTTKQCWPPTAARCSRSAATPDSPGKSAALSASRKIRRWPYASAGSSQVSTTGPDHERHVLGNRWHRGRL